MLTWTTIFNSSIALIMGPAPLFTRLLTNGPRNLQMRMLVSEGYPSHFAEELNPSLLQENLVPKFWNSWKNTRTLNICLKILEWPPRNVATWRHRSTGKLQYWILKLNIFSPGIPAGVFPVSIKRTSFRKVKQRALWTTITNMIRPMKLAPAWISMSLVRTPSMRLYKLIDWHTRFRWV